MVFKLLNQLKVSEANMRLRTHLKKLGACQPALDWVGNKTRQEAWDQCKQISWFRWWLQRSELNYSRAIDFGIFALKRWHKDEREYQDILRIEKWWNKGCPTGNVPDVDGSFGRIESLIKYIEDCDTSQFYFILTSYVKIRDIKRFFPNPPKLKEPS